MDQFDPISFGYYLETEDAKKNRDIVSVQNRPAKADPIPASLNWDLWKGPAVIDQYHANLVHYKWHWFWPTGNGDMNNQGTHQLDVARWAIDDDQAHPVRVMGMGGRFAWNDQGETPKNSGTRIGEPEDDTPETEKDAEAEFPPLRMVEAQVKRLESEIDEMNGALSPLRSFILPGGSALAAHLHVCRTVARRAERLATDLSTAAEVNPHVITYLNRLSDWFFVAARIANENGENDVLWVPGANR